MIIFHLKINMYISLAHTPLLMMVLKTCQLSTSCVLGSFGRRGLVQPSSSWGSPHPRKNPKTKLPGVVHLLVPCPLSLLLFSKHPRVRGIMNMNWRSGVTKVTLQTYIVNKQIVARNIYYSLYRAVSSRISQTRVCGKNNFLLFPHKRFPPHLNETLGVQFTPKISEPSVCMT